MNRKIVIGLLGCLLLVGLLLWWLDAPAKKQSAAQQQLSAAWKPEFELKSTDPRGLGFFNDLLETHISDSAKVAKRFSQLDSIPGADSATYLFIGNDFVLTQQETNTLFHLIDSGATLFLSFDQVTSDIYTLFFEESAFHWEYNSKLYVAMEDTSLAYYNVFQNDTIHDDWYTFVPEAIKDTLYKAFAFSMYEPIAFEVKWGKGKVILHSIPRLFVNYQVLRPNGFTHASYLLRKIPRNKPAIWLECGRFDPNSLNQSTNADEEGKGNEKQDDSYLQFIMSNEALRWAFMLAILVLLLYALFRAKRRETVLPGAPEKRNMSLAFVETLSSIYLSRNSPYGILQVLRKNFYMSMSRHFYIDLLSTNPSANTAKREEDIKRLLEKSSVDEEELRQLLKLLDTPPESQQHVNETTLGEAYRSIRTFYVQTGISKTTTRFVTGSQYVLLHRSLLQGMIGVFLGLVVLLRGLYGLAAGSGYGILLVAASFAFLYLGIRFLSTPVARITTHSLVLYKPFMGRKELDLNNGISYTRTTSETTFYSEDGNQLTIPHRLLSRTGKNALNLFIEHIKHKSA